MKFTILFVNLLDFKMVNELSKGLKRFHLWNVGYEFNDKLGYLGGLAGASFEPEYFAVRFDKHNISRLGHPDKILPRVVEDGPRGSCRMCSDNGDHYLINKDAPRSKFSQDNDLLPYLVDDFEECGKAELDTLKKLVPLF